MRKFYQFSVGTILLAASSVYSPLFSQVTTTYNTNAMQLVQNLVGNGVIVTSATLTCPAVGSGTFTTSGACSSVGVSQGVVLTTGDLVNVPGPNNIGSAGVDNAGGGSPLLDPLAGAGTQDACILTFTFIPTTGSLSFQYMFGSEEYPEFVNSGYNDAFGFFLTGPNPFGPAYNNTNLALIPSTTTPVTIDNVNSGMNSGYYQDNTGGTCYQYDGFTTTLTAQANVTPCNSYTITIAIADAGDGAYDSGVMLQENSFSSGNFDAILVSQTNATCSTLGSATVSASGGTAPYTYTWNTSPVQNTPTATNLPAGNYTCVVSYNVCSQLISDTVHVTITGTSTVTAAISGQTNVTCNGGNNGSATVTAGGGAGGYTYAWAPSGGSGATANNLTAGIYTVTVTDAVGCISNTTVTITQPAALSTSGSQTNVTCNGGNNGTATVTPSGGTGGYTYAWAPSGGSGATGTNLTAGGYTVTVTDANGCTITRTYTITQPAAITPNPSQTNINCFGGNTGSATVNPSGGAGAYTYAWAPSGGSGATANSLTAGGYTVTITDGSGCTLTQSFTITQPSALATVPAQTNVSCNGGNNGSATVNAAGGTGAYTYAWAPSGGSGTTASNLTAGGYTVTVTDANGCTRSQTYTITQPTALSLPMSQVNATCGSANGSGTVTPSGGAGGYTYVWAPSGGNGSTANGLSAGGYTVTVTDANGCTGTGSVTILNTGAPTASVTAQTDVTCYGGNNGSATVTALGGGGGNTYTWTPSGGSGTTANSLTAGSYTVTVTDMNNCSTTASVTITQPTQLTASISSTTDITCFGSNDGTASSTANGGAGGYTYTWAPSGGSSSNAANLGNGTYTVTITDANGCTATASATITEPTQVTLNLTAQTDVTCFGYTDGSANLNGGGGTGALSYTWSPGGPGGSSSNTLGANTYTVTLSDANNCTATVSFTITEPAGMVLNLTATDDSICAGDPVTMTMNAAGGSGAYTYTWNGVSGGSLSNVNPGATTQYQVVVTDNNGCSQSQSVTVNVGPIPTASFTASNVCDGQPVDFTNTSATNGATISGQTWDFGDLSPTSSVNNPSYTYSGPGAYNVTLSLVTDFGCTVSVTQAITVNDVPLVSFTSDQLAGCMPLCVNFSDLTNAGNGVINSWNWQANGQNISNAQNPNYCFANPGSYDITLSVSSTNGCSSTLTLPNYIQVYNFPVADFNMSSDNVPESDPLVYFTDASLGSVGTWAWDFGDGGTSSVQNPAHIFADTGEYCITLTVTSPEGCLDDIKYCLYVYPEVFIYIPNTFTPNEDNINENFLVYGRGLAEATLLIFDRWGEPIARLDNDQPFTIGWDGRYNGDRVKEDVYTYKLFVVDVKGDKHEYHGHVNVIY